jgi:hypothetical protein
LSAVRALMDCCRLLVWGMEKRELTKSSMKDRDPGLQVPQQSSESTFYGPKYVVMVDKLVVVVVRLISLADDRIPWSANCSYSRPGCSDH